MKYKKCCTLTLINDERTRTRTRSGPDLVKLYILSACKQIEAWMHNLTRFETKRISSVILTVHKSIADRFSSLNFPFTCATSCEKWEYVHVENEGERGIKESMTSVKRKRNLNKN